MRDWGPWTLIKLETLEKYFSAFTNASRGAKGTLYVDLFGGRPENRERETERVFPGSALRAAAADPPFSKLLVSELDPRAASEQADRLRQIAGERALVLPGDCNTVIPHAMRNLDPGYRWAPTFALLDQYSAEIRWSTLEFLAGFKSPKARTKVELCMFFGESFIVRGLHGPNGTVNRGYARRIDEMFGSRAWRQIQAARDDDVITGGQLQVELVNLMRWQLEHLLGYTTTVPLQIRNTHGTGIFTMIFATDHEAGDRIMRHLFEGAEDALAVMVENSKIQRRLKKDEAIGQNGLFDLEPVTTVSDSPRSLALPPMTPFAYDREWIEDER